MASIPRESVYDEFFDFLLSHISAETILAYQASDKSIEYAAELIERMSAGTLSAEEAATLEQMRQLDNFVTILKIKASIVSRRS